MALIFLFFFIKIENNVLCFHTKHGVTSCVIYWIANILDPLYVCCITTVKKSFFENVEEISGVDQ